MSNPSSTLANIASVVLAVYAVFYIVTRYGG